MAAPANSPNPWGKVGSWALDAEAEEAAAAAAPAATLESFPSLKEAATGGGKSKKKSKGTTFSLSEFTTGNYAGPANRRPPEPTLKGLSADELMHLPTGPRERTAEELEQARSRSFRLRDDDRRPTPRSMEQDLPSRADESDNWGSSKKSLPFSSDTGRRGGGPDQYSGPSRADDTNDWNSAKKTMAPAPVPGRYREGPKFDSRASDSDRWGRGLSLDNGLNRERPRLVLDPPKRDVTAAASLLAAEMVRDKPSPFGAARPREEVLAEKGLDWKKMDTEVNGKESGLKSEESVKALSEHSSRPGSAGSAEEGAAKPRQKVNPFGSAKPREVVLQEKGIDWKRMDFELKHHRPERLETEQEKELKEVIGIMKEQLKETEARVHAGSEEVSAEDVQGIYDKLLQKKKELEQLINDFDEKFQLREKNNNGAFSGSGSNKVAPISQDAVGSRDTEGAENQFSDGTQSVQPTYHGGRVEPRSRPVEGWGFSSKRESFGSQTYARPMVKQRW